MENANYKNENMEKIRPIKNTWYDWLINYIPKPKRKSVGGFKACACYFFIKFLFLTKW